MMDFYPDNPILRALPVIANIRLELQEDDRITLSFHNLRFESTQLQRLPARFVLPLPMDKQVDLPQNSSFPILHSPTNLPHSYF
jgi:hypothetical protein